MGRAHTGALVVVVAGAMLAGCLQGTPTPLQTQDSDARPAGLPEHFDEQLPLPILRCYDGARCNQEMTPTPKRQGNEVTIAVNPKDPKNIVGGAKDYFPTDAGQCVWDGIYVTHDAGATPYHDRSFDGSPWRLLTDPSSFKPNYASQFWCTTDPVAYFDVHGTFYYLLMAYQTDPATAMKPQNDFAFNRATQIVAISSDGGDTFHTFTPVFEGTFPVMFHDKGWIAAGNDGTIHVLWFATFAPGNFYWRSTDGGKSFGDPQVLGGIGAGPDGQGSFLDVGPGREVYAAWSGGNNEQFRRSLDGGATWSPAQSLFDITPSSMRGLSGRDRRGGFPAMATDKNPESPLAGAIYFVWQDGADGNADVRFSASFDKGDTWTDPIVLNDDVDGNGTVDPSNWQIFPVVSVSPLGVVDVSWMDTRLDPKDYRLDQFSTYSLDGGKTWSRNFRTRDANDTGWDPKLSHHQNGQVFIGDYIDIDSSWGASHPVWPDTRSGDAVDVYTAILQRPIFPSAMDATKRSEWKERLLRDHLVEPDHPFLEG